MARPLEEIGPRPEQIIFLTMATEFERMFVCPRCRCELLPLERQGSLISDAVPHRQPFQGFDLQKEAHRPGGM